MTEPAEPIHPRPPRALPGPAFWVALGLNLVVAVLLAFVPLFNLLGYEFCAAVSFLVSMTAGPVAIGTVRQRWPQGPGEVRPLRDVAAVALRAMLQNGLTLILPLGVILLNALRVRNCNLPEGLLFFLLLPVCTALVFSAWGTAIGLSVRRPVLGGLAFTGLWLAMVALNVWEFYVGHQMDSYNQLMGWVAGPVYEEVVHPSLPLLLSRLYGLAGAWLVLVALASLLDVRERRFRIPALRSNRRPVLLAAGLALIVGGFALWSDELGFGRSRDVIDSELAGVTRTRHFVIHHRADLDPGEARRLARDHEFRFHQIERVIGRQDLPLIHSYVFSSAGAKRRLLGAGRTQFAKPWTYSMYLNGTRFPHPVLKHELTHVMAAGFGTWPFRASARSAVWQNAGLTEGLAVAIDWPARKFDPHTWSAAQRRNGQAPDLRDLFDPVGFWTKAGRRAYTLAGSFVRHLIDRHGCGPFRSAYRNGSLEGAYPASSEELIREHEAFLDGLVLELAVVEAARLRFSRRSIFSRVCAHEISALRVRAARHLAAKRYAEAEATLGEVLEHIPGDVDALESLAELRVDQERIDDAIAILEPLTSRDDLGDALRARIGGRIGDLLARRNHLDVASDRFRALLAANIDDGTDRMALVKLQALQHGDAGQRVLAFLERGKVEAATLLDLREVCALVPQWGTAWYLLGRQLFNRGLYDKALPYLERAGVEGFSHPALAAENLRLLAVCHFRQGRHDRAAAMWAVTAMFPRHEGERLQALDWLERVRFEATYDE